MLEQILRSIKDYFIKEVWHGIFLISNGSLADVDFIKEDQYFKIHGSDLNDGIYKYPTTDLNDEEFKGEIWVLNIPQEIVDIAAEREQWEQKNADKLNSPFNSESFAGYSYTLKSSGSETGGGIASGTAFNERLKQWRKACYDTDIKRNQYSRQV